MPSLTFNGQQALYAFLVGMVNPVAGFAYAVASDQFSNKHASTQVSQALLLLAGSPLDTPQSGAVKLERKAIGWEWDPSTGENKPRYSQTEFEVRDAATGALLSTVKFSGAGADRMIEVFDAATGALQSRTTLTETGSVTVRPITGGSVEVRYLTDAATVQPDGTITAISKDVDGNVLSSSNTQVDSNGIATTTTSYPDGRLVIETRDPSRQLIGSQEILQDSSGAVVTKSYDPGHVLQSTKVSKGYADGSTEETTTNPDGGWTHVVYDPDQHVISSTGAAAPLQTLGTTLQDINSLIGAIRSGRPLPVLSSGLHLINDLTNPVVNGTQVLNNQPLFTTTAVAGAIGSLYGLYQTFNGDSTTLDKISASANALVAVSTAANVVSAQLAGEATVQALTGAVGAVAQAVPFLNAAVALEHGDYTGAAVAVASYFVPVVGWAYAAYSIITALGAEEPEAWGMAHFKFADGTTLTVDTTGEGIGIGKVTVLTQGNGEPALLADGTRNPNYFGGLLGYLNDVIAQAEQANPRAQLGIIPQRLPQLTWHESRLGDPGYALVDIDPLTGEARYPALRYGDNYTPFNADATDPGQRKDLFQRMVDGALAREAIAPMWEVHTARLQQDNFDPDAGLTEEERDAKHGLSAPADASGKRLPGKFRPVVLDLNGDGMITTVSDAASDVSFDWDDSGYVKQTGWVGAGEGLVVLDRNLNNVADSGKELFSNGLVSDAAKGVRSMAWVDANADGVIDASDPVFAALSVWQDSNLDGVQDASETKTLESLGITQLDYGNGRFSRAGQLYAMQSPDLEASNEGVQVKVVQGGIQVDYSNGQSTLFVTQVIDLGGGSGQGTVFTAHDDGFISWEDGVSPGSDSANPRAQTPSDNQAISISFSQLLANDAFNGSNAGLTVTAVGNSARGTAVLNPTQGTVQFTPEHNYVGQASFEYTVTASNGQTRVANALIDLKAVNDAPSISTTTDHRLVYGYAHLNYSYSYYTGGEDGSTITTSGTTLGEPIYAPYIEEIKGAPIIETRYSGGEDGGAYDVIVGYQPSTYVNRDTPIGSDDAGTGHVSAVDADGPSTFHYEVIDNALYGKATVDGATGAWSYLGSRPAGLGIGDVTGDGISDYVDPDTGTVYPDAPPGNIDSNRYGANETNADGTNYFLDQFTVRVHDDAGGYTDQVVSVKHYGPRPLPNVASGGGKKPIAIDLNGDGFHFTNVDDSNVFYDVNGDGWRRKIAWNSNDDGFIAYDKNGDGKIDRFDEISFVPYKPDAQTDLEGLKAFDTNGDGVFSAADAKWSAFGVWRDANGNGVTDPGEFKSLNDLGINAISLSSDGHFQIIDGQTVHGIGSATKSDGSTFALADVTLQYRNQAQATAADGSTVTATVATYSAGQTFTGTADADLVFGTAGSDQYHMGDGNDVVNDDAGDDRVEAGAGDDTVFAGAGKDYVDAGDGKDSVFAGDGDDLALGGAGDDFLSMGNGNDVAFGGNGNDLVSGGGGNDLLSGDAGDDKLFGEGGWDVLFGMDGDDELWGGDGNDQLHGGTGNDLLAGGAGEDAMDGGSGNDSYEVDSAGDVVTEKPGEGEDTVRASISYTLGAEFENLTLSGSDALQGTGNAANNHLIGNDAANVLRGLDGNDTLDGGQGADTLIGGAGDDTYVIDNAGDVVLELADEGVDTVNSRITSTLGDNVENLTLIGINAINGTGNALANVMTGNAAANRIDGGAGADRMLGGAGNDSYVVDDAGDRVIELVGEGYDTVLSNLVSYALSDNVEALVLGAGAISGTGNALNNTLSGNAGANILDGGAGADVMLGGSGDDSYVVDDAGDVVIEGAAAGVDRVISSVTYALAANVENLSLTGTSTIDATGNELDNVLSGNAGNNRLDGGAGADSLSGGSGDDSYVIDNAGDQVIELADQGYDRVSSSINYVLTANVEQLTLVGTALYAKGNALDNLLFGNDLANVLDGAAGADQMSGGLGDDRYIVDNIGDTVTEAVNAGIDTVVSSVSCTLAANVENLILSGTSVIDGTGNADANVLVGNTANNTLSAGAGNDVLAGGLGNDALEGGAGDDLYLYNQGEGRDVITDASGTDTLRFGTGISLDSIAARTVTINGQSKVFISVLSADGTEQQDQGIELAATGGIERFEFANGQVATLSQIMVTGRTIYGSSTADTLTGDRRDDTIKASDGNDTLYGRSGNDVLYGENGKDLLFGEGGNDKLYGGVEDDQLWGGAGDDYLDGDNGADTLVGGTGNDQLWGGNDADVLDAGDGNDTLDGANGEDKLYAGAGNDTLDGGNDSDMLAAGAGNDVIRAGSGQDVVIAGAGDDTIDAGNDSDFVDGGAGNDIINAGSGSDFIAGGRGNDTIDAGQDYDVIAFNRGDGADTLLTSSWQRDTLSLGGGIRYADLSLSKSGNDLVLGLGQGDSVTFKNWYLDSTRHNLTTLQMVTAAAGGDYVAGSSNRMLGSKVVSFDFEQLANRYDQVRAANPGLASWSLASVLDTYYQRGSDTQALGGDLAYRYATQGSAGSGSYGDLDAAAVRNRMNGLSGSSWQAWSVSTAVDPWTALQAGISLIADQTVGLPSPITPAAAPSPDELAFAALNASGRAPAWMGSAGGRVLP